MLMGKELAVPNSFSKMPNFV